MDAESIPAGIGTPEMAIPEEIPPIKPVKVDTAPRPQAKLLQAPPPNSTDIAAYFALEFVDMQYIYYLQRWSVSLGRSDAAADIDLGPLKNISRLHARIEYEEEQERFVLAIIGRNGAFVDGIWREPGLRVPLAQR